MRIHLPVFVLITLLLFTFSTLHAQNGDLNTIKKTSRDGRIRFLKFQADKKSPSQLDTSVQSIKSLLNLGSKHQLFRENIRETTRSGITQRHSRLNQYFNGLKVEFGVLNIQSSNGRLNSISGEYFNLSENFDTKAALSESNALQRALVFMGAKKYSWEDKKFIHDRIKGKPKGQLVICKDFTKNSSEDTIPSMRLAYKFAVYAIEPLRYDFIYVDASDGKILLDNPIIKHVDAPAATRYSGRRNISTSTGPAENYLLKDSGSVYRIATYNLNKGSEYATAPLFSDADNDWSSEEYDNSNYDNAALDAHWGAMMTLDYWRTVHNRNSFDNQGGMIRNYVHYGTDYVNAFWDGYVMSYGDGDGSNWFPLTSIDICGHEIGHAVCQYTANLIYSGESGAMNEGFSDIWGACIKNFAAPEKNTWVIGDESNSSGTPFRSFINPKAFNQPDTYRGANWVDGGDVHTNSGILNHWFYILTEGKAGTNDHGFSYNVSGIGISKASEIAYRAESVYLFPSATYADGRIAAIQAAEDLFGKNSNEVLQTSAAWDAVGVYEEISSPSNLALTPNGNEVTMNWSFLSSQSISGFAVERSVNLSSFIQVALLPPGTLTYIDSTAVVDATNSYRVRTVKNSRYSDYSNIATIAIGQPPFTMQNSWKGTVDNNWFDPQNWSSGAVPTTTMDVVVEGGKSNYPLITSDITLRSLTIYSGARVEIAAGVKVNIQR